LYRPQGEGARFGPTGGSMITGKVNFSKNFFSSKVFKDRSDTNSSNNNA